MDYNELAKQFTEFYYSMYNPKFDEELQFLEDDFNRKELASLYCDTSLVTYHNEEIMGTEKIMEYMLADKVKGHYEQMTNVLAQPSVDDSVLIVVQGDSFFPSPEENPNDEKTPKLHYTEIFLIAQDQESGSFIIHNQVFSTQGF